MIISKLQESWFRFCRLLTALVIVPAFGVRYSGQRNIPARGPLIIASNHQSFLDPLLLGFGVRRVVHFLARSTLFDIPFLGRLISSVNAHPVKRGATDTHALRCMLSILREGGVLVVFPEGTRTSDGRIGSLKQGLGAVAARAGAMILPVCVDGAFRCWPRQRTLPGRGRIAVRFGTPVAPDPADKGRAAMLEVKRQLERMLVELMAERPG